MRSMICAVFWRRNLSYLWIALLTATVLTAPMAACGSRRATPPSPVKETSTGLYDFKFTMYQGKRVLGVAEEGMFSELLSQGKPVVMNMWGGLCPPCRKEMPDLERVYESYRDRIVLFGLDVGPFVRLGNRTQARAMFDIFQITYPAGTTFDEKVVARYTLEGIPATFFITPDGEVFSRWEGLMTEEQIVEEVERLLAESD